MPSAPSARLFPLLHPFAAIRQRFRAWWLQRLPCTDTQLLTQGNIYILPTGAGLMFGATLIVLLLASINYQLNLGYILTFLLTGSGVVSMHLTHSTLRGLTLQLRSPQPVFTGTPAVLDVTLANTGRARFGIGLRVESQPAQGLTWTDVEAGGHAHAQVSFVPPTRGLHPVPALVAETRFPLGLFRAWAVWRPAARVLAYPAPEHPAAPLPVRRAAGHGKSTARRASDGGEVEGVRGYRRGDPLKLVLWKKAARQLETGGELVSRDTSAVAQQDLWLEWDQCAGLPPESRLSRLAAWLLVAERAGTPHGLRLPGLQIEPDVGDAHQRRCLEGLALWQ